MTRKALVIGVTLIVLTSIILVVLLMDFDNDGMANWRDTHPTTHEDEINRPYEPPTVTEYAISRGLLSEIIEQLEPLDNDKVLDEYERKTIDELSKLDEYSFTPYIKLQLDSVVEDGEISEREYWGFYHKLRDWDGDYVSNELDPNPIEIDADGGGMDDFNEIYTWEMDPNDPNDDKEFMKKIPNVVPRHWNSEDGGVDLLHLLGGVIEISMRDPYIQWLAERSEIRWETTPEGEKFGVFYVDSERVFKEYGTAYEGWGIQPSYYFTHGRKGSCANSAHANLPILRLMGYKAKMIGGRVPVDGEESGHEWNEVYIDGTVYVVNFNNVYPREGFYEKTGWTIHSSDYNPDWYKND